MNSLTKSALELVVKSNTIEATVHPDVKDFTSIVDTFLDLNTQIVTLQQALKGNSSEEEVRTLLSDSKSCNIQHIKILSKLDVKRSGKSDYPFSAYRHDTAELSTLLEARDTLAAKLDAERLKESSNYRTELTKFMHEEDSALINILIAVSYADGKTHKKERKMIAQQYEKITLQKLDEEQFEKSLASIDDTIDEIILRLKSEAANLYPEVKKLLLLSAIEMTIVDRTIHEQEIVLIKKLSEALAIDDPRFASITSREDIINLAN